MKIIFWREHILKSPARQTSDEEQLEPSETNLADALLVIGDEEETTKADLEADRVDSRPHYEVASIIDNALWVIGIGIADGIAILWVTQITQMLSQVHGHQRKLWFCLAMLVFCLLMLSQTINREAIFSGMIRWKRDKNETYWQRIMEKVSCRPLPAEPEEESLGDLMAELMNPIRTFMSARQLGPLAAVSAIVATLVGEHLPVSNYFINVGSFALLLNCFHYRGVCSVCPYNPSSALGRIRRYVQSI